MKIFILISLYLLISCSKNNGPKNIVKKWQNKEIILPPSLTDTITQDSIWKSLLTKKYKIFSFIDENVCTECFLKLHDWQIFINQIDSISNDVAFLFIIHTKDYSIVETLKEKNNFTYPIFYDYKNRINTLNKLPQDPRYLTFLLNETNNILLIGNPISNNYLKKLYKQTIVQYHTDKQSIKHTSKNKQSILETPT